MPLEGLTDFLLTPWPHILLHGQSSSARMSSLHQEPILFCFHAIQLMLSSLKLLAAVVSYQPQALCFDIYVLTAGGQRQDVPVVTIRSSRFVPSQ